MLHTDANMLREDKMRQMRHGRPQKFFQGGGHVHILFILFRFLTMQCKQMFTKRFTLSTPQRKCSMLRQRLQTVLPLTKTFLSNPWPGWGFCAAQFGFRYSQSLLHTDKPSLFK